MNRVIIFCLSLGLLGATCTTTPTSTWMPVAQFDITGDNKIDKIQIKDSGINLSSDLQDAYTFDFSELQVITSDNTMLLQVTTEGIISEDGSKLKPSISTQAAYAFGLGKQVATNSKSDSLFYIVQIDSAGKAVSEPITFTWDQVGSKWVMGK